MRITVYIAIFSIVMMASCKKAQSPGTPEDGYWVTVQHAAGDDYAYNGQSYFSYPFHDAKFKKFEDEGISCAIISKKLNAGSKLKVMPRALLTYEEQDMVKKCIIAVPSDSTLMSLEISNFSDFMIKYASVRNIIELWQLNKCGNGCAKMIQWKDENAAGLLIEKNLIR